MNLFVAIRVFGDSAITSASGSAHTHPYTHMFPFQGFQEKTLLNEAKQIIVRESNANASITC